MKVSIIIPVYNLESLISRCLESILAQSFTDYEIILIDDGSTDNSITICNQYARDNKRISVISQNNSGVSVARNNGVKAAKGEWICFIDGDDFIEDESLIQIFNQGNLENFDCIISRSYINSGKERLLEKYTYPDSFVDKTFTGIELGVREAYLRGSIWGVMYRRDVFIDNNIWFPINIKNGEDTIVFSLVLIHFKKMTFSNVSFYNVYERPGSASRSWTFSRIIDMIDNLKYINAHIRNNKELTPESINILHYNLYRVVSAIYNAFSTCFSFKDFIVLSSKIRNELKYKIDVGSMNVSNSKINLLNSSLLLFGMLTVIKNRF